MPGSRSPGWPPAYPSAATSNTPTGSPWRAACAAASRSIELEFFRAILDEGDDAGQRVAQGLDLPALLRTFPIHEVVVVIRPQESVDGFLGGVERFVEEAVAARLGGGQGG